MGKYVLIITCVYNYKDIVYYIGCNGLTIHILFQQVYIFMHIISLLTNAECIYFVYIHCYIYIYISINKYTNII